MQHYASARNELKSRLEFFLSKIDRKEFCCSGEAPELPSIPGLLVEGVGEISLPLLSQQAQSLMTVARQAPFGKGRRTIVDTNVREVYAIMLEISGVRYAYVVSNPALIVLSIE